MKHLVISNINISHSDKQHYICYIFYEWKSGPECLDVQCNIIWPLDCFWIAFFMALIPLVQNLDNHRGRGPFCQVFDAVIKHPILAGRPSSWRLKSSHRSFELHLKHRPTCGDSSDSWVLDGYLWRCGGTCGGGSVNL